MMARRNSPIAAAAPMMAARMTPIDWTMIPTRSTLGATGPAYQPQRIPTMRPPTSRPTPILRLFPLPKYAVKAPVITRNRANVSRRMVKNVGQSSALNAILLPSELDSRQRLRVDDSRNRPDFVDHDLT